MTDAATSPIAQWRVDVDDYVQVLEVCRDQGRAVVGSLGGDAALIDIDDGSATALERHEMGVLSAAWSSDGSRLAVGGQDGCVRIYDCTGATQGVVDTSAWVTALAWSPNAPVLAIGAGRHLLITDLDGALLHDFDDQPSTVTAVAWSADGSRVGTMSSGSGPAADVASTGRDRCCRWRCLPTGHGPAREPKTRPCTCGGSGAARTSRCRAIRPKSSESDSATTADG